MTNSEAIKMLKSKMDGSVDTSYEWTECVRLAIKALEEQDNPNSIRINFTGKEEEFKRYEKELLEKLKKQPLTVIPKEQPCEDAISREDVLEWIDESLRRYGGTYSTDMLNMWGLFKDWIGKMPSVTPKPKMGQWINKYAEDACGERYSYWACSECGRDVGFNLANIEDVLSEYPYCHCGAKMVEPQESEDKE